MSLVFSAITPHSPLLIPSIGKDSLKKMQKTVDALEKLEEDLYLTRPDIILVISPHSHYFADAFSVNLSEKFQTDFKEFGDLTTKLKYSGEIQLPYHIRSGTYPNKGLHTIIINEPDLEYGAGVPLMYLTKHLPEIKILPVGISELDAKTHFEYGYMLKEQIMKINKRIAVIASGNLSHALATEAPAGFHKDGAVYDKKVQEYLSSHNSTGLVTMEKDLIKNAAECGYRPFLILMGILRDVNYHYESLSYESPFGVGHLTANFVL